MRISSLSSKVLLLGVLVLGIAIPTLADTDSEMAGYSFPAGAMRVMYSTYTREGEKSYAILPPNTQDQPILQFSPPPGALGTETYYKGVLIRQRILKPGTPYSIIRQWYDDGTPRSEAHYKKRLEDGTFKFWNQQGQLVGQYKMTEGKGMKRSYHDNGRLKSEVKMLTPVDYELAVWCYPSGRVFSIDPATPPHANRLHFEFSKDSSVITISGEGGQAGNGFTISFERDGTLVSKAWLLGPYNRAVSEAEYSQATLTSPELPPYYADASRYFELFTPEIKAIYEKYSHLPPVQIPLQFDANGQPLLAP